MSQHGWRSPTNCPNTGVLVSREGKTRLRLQPLKKVYFFKKRYTVILFWKKVSCDTFSKRKVYRHTFFQKRYTVILFSKKVYRHTFFPKKVYVILFPKKSIKQYQARQYFFFFSFCSTDLKLYMNKTGKSMPEKRPGSYVPAGMPGRFQGITYLHITKNA